MQQWTEALAAAEEALDLARELGDRRAERLALSRTANALNNLGQNVRGLETAQQALAVARELNDPDGAIDALNSIAWASYRLGQYPEQTSDPESRRLRRASSDSFIHEQQLRVTF